ncbi:MAG: MATE family efflux transporter [Coprococcus sp.]
MRDKMTEGSVYKTLLSLTGPVLVGQVLQQLYNIGDTVIIGRFVGVNALASVGACWALNYIISYFCIGSCMAISVPLSQCYGANDKKALRCYFFNGIYSAVVLALVMTLVATLGCGCFLKWLHTPEKIYHDAYVYIFIVMCGLPFVIIYNFCYGVLMAFGDSKRASMYMGVSTVLNLALDLIFVLVFNLGVGGAALATTISQVFAAILSLLYIIKKYPILYTDDQGRILELKSGIRRHQSETAPNRVYIANIIRMCLPMGVQYSITAIGALVLQKSLNSLGSEAIAAYSSGQKVKSLLLCPLSALGTSLAAFVGQNYGAQMYSRVREGILKSNIIGFVYSGITLIIMYIFRIPIAYIFVDKKEVVTVEYIATFILFCALFDFLLTILFCFRFAVQGMGYGRYSIFSAVAEMLGRSLTAIFLVPKFGFTAVALSEGLTFLAGIVVIVPIYFCLRRRLLT